MESALPEHRQFDPGVRELAQLAACALAEVPTHAPEPLRGNGLRQATGVVADLMAALSGRVAKLPEVGPALRGALVVLRGLADLGQAPVSGADLALELAGMRQALLDLITVPGGLARESPLWAGQPQPDWGARWLVGQQVLELFTACAGAAIGAAGMRLRRGERVPTLVALRRAITYVRGQPAALAHACAMPTDQYQRITRPTPPGHARCGLRAAIDRLLTALPERYAELHEQDPELAGAREELLEADLVDCERQVTLAYTMLSPRRSPAHRRDAGVAELRRVRQERTIRYAPYLRFSELAAGGRG